MRYPRLKRKEINIILGDIEYQLHTVYTLIQPLERVGEPFEEIE